MPKWLRSPTQDGISLPWTNDFFGVVPGVWDDAADADFWDVSTTTSVSLQVNAIGNDAYQDRGGSADITAVSASIGTGNILSSPARTYACRFVNAPIPQGVTILSAVLKLRQASTSFNNVLCTWYAENVDNAAIYVNGEDLAARARTTANVACAENINRTGGTFYPYPTTGSWVGPLQEVISRAGWVSGNAVGFMAVGNGGSSFASTPVDSYDNAPAAAATLDLVYQNASGNIVALIGTTRGQSTSWTQAVILRGIAARAVPASRASSAVPVLRSVASAARASAQATRAQTATLRELRAFTLAQSQGRGPLATLRAVQSQTLAQSRAQLASGIVRGLAASTIARAQASSAVPVLRGIVGNSRATVTTQAPLGALRSLSASARAQAQGQSALPRLLTLQAIALARSSASASTGTTALVALIPFVG